MHYDDAARRYNFLAGLGIGAVLGVGLGMIVLPQKRVLMRRVRGSRGTLLREKGLASRSARWKGALSGARAE